jgi:FAD/FMN-containing dehydrogenase
MYGTTAENVVTLKVVTPEGKLVQTRRRVRKSAGDSCMQHYRFCSLSEE